MKKILHLIKVLHVLFNKHKDQELNKEFRYVDG
jgi:hypothetical protein